MKKMIPALIIAFLFSATLHAQPFLDKAQIEYEVKSNIKKTMGNNSWEEMMKENLPTFKTAYYTFIFADNKSIYKFDHWDEKAKLPEFMRRDDETDSWYADHTTGKMISQKTFSGSTFNIQDTLPAMQWRIMNESRMIAGFNCRKAVAKIFDSVYVFAFYTDEIIIPGGPCSLNGLPGLILGVTIPRLYTSWIATKISVNGIPLSGIKPAEAKKYYTNASMKKLLEERTKDWWDGEDATEEQKQQKNRVIWAVML